MTQASVARLSWEKECSRAGKATFTMDRSREAMKAPRAVTTKMVRCRAVVMPGATWSTVDSVMEPTVEDCVASCN